MSRPKVSFYVLAFAVFVLAQATMADAFADGPVGIQIQVIRASKTETKFDPRLEALREGLPGYTGAEIVDAVKTQVAEGARVSLEILNRSRVLEVRVLEVDRAKKSVKLRLVIEALKFSAETTHKKEKATVLVRHKTSEQEALFFAVTPEL